MTERTSETLGMRLIRLGQRWIGDSWLARLLVRLGVVRRLRARHDRAIVASGRHTVNVADRDIVFAVSHRQQVWELDAAWRESAMLDELLAEASDGDMFIDAGANLGLFSLAVALHRPGCRVIAFEPDPDTAEALRENIALNHCTNIDVRAVALGASEGEATLYTTSESGGGSHTLVSTGENAREVKVAVTTLDAELQPQSNARLIVKLDIEGAEYDALRGMARLLESEAIKLVLIEMHPRLLRQRSQCVEAIVTLLQNAGYESRWSHDRATEVHACYALR